MIKEKFSGFKELMLSKKARHITATVAVTFAVFLFFIWLGVGMYISVPRESRGELWPVFGMYGVFPLLIFFFGIKRALGILNNDEDEENDSDMKEENEE